MFGNNFKFRMVVKHSDEAVIHVKEHLLENGVVIYDLREADIINNSDKRLMDKCYVLCCKSSRKMYERLKTKFNYTELKYENFKTLI